MRSVLPTTVAIIGAGLTGLVCAERLRAAGVNAIVVEKSRDIGGRLATRRREGRAWNHGAPRVNVRCAEFRAQIETLRALGHAEWLPGGMAAVGVPDARELLRPLSDGGVEFAAEVGRLQRGPVGWSLLLLDGRALGPFDIVVCTAPVPQTCRLLHASGVAIPDVVARIEYAPCWALLLALPESAIDLGSLAESEVFGYVGRPLVLGGRSVESTWVLHANPDWSTRHLEHTAQDVQRLLLAEVVTAAGLTSEPVAAFAHRWRFARAVQPVSRDSLWLPAPRIAIGGDGFAGGDADGAFRSALGLASTVLGAVRKPGS